MPSLYLRPRLEFEVETQPDRVIFVEDHLLVSEALVAAVTRDGSIEVVATVASVAEARRALSQHRVDVVVVDFQLPDGNGLELAKFILAQYPRTQVIMLTAKADKELLSKALQVGCAGFISKHESLVHLPAAIHSAASGTTTISPLMAAKLVEPQTRTLQDPTKLLSREVEILRLMAEGRSAQEITSILFMSPSTLRNHILHINQKLDVHTRAEALARAIQLGIVAPKPQEGPGRS